MNLRFLFCFPLLLLLLTSCAVHKRVFNHGERASRQKDWDRAIRYYLRSLEKKPNNVEYRIALSRALITASNINLRKGINFFKDGEFKLALLAFDKSLEFNPENNEARRQKRVTLKKVEELRKKYREKTELEKIKEKAKEAERIDSKLELTGKVFDFRVVNQSLKNIFKALSSVSGVYFLFDEGFKARKMSINLEQTTVLEVIETITSQTKLFYKILDVDRIIIIPDTPAKRRKYEELVMKTFFLSDGDPEEIRKIISSLTGLKTIAVSKTLNSLTITALPEEVKLAEKIIRTHDKPKGEVVIEIEVIEVNKKTIREYGIELSQYQVGEYYSPGPLTEAGTSTIRVNALKHSDASDFLLSLPSLNYKLLKFSSRSKIKARPRLRVMDKEKVKVRLGDKVPIPTTTFVPQYGGSTPNQQPITSYKMEDVGINIEITPRIHHDGLVTLETKFELTFITDPGTPTLPPTIGKRSVDTLIRLRDNETCILAGLLRDTERKSLQGLPILSNLPVLKHIFSGNKNEIEQTDIVITLTPRIVRFPEISREDLEYSWVGTRSRPGLRESPPFRLQEKKEADEDQEVGKEEGEKSAEKEIKINDKKETVLQEEKAEPPEKDEEKKIPEEKPVEPVFSLNLPGQIKEGGTFLAGLNISGNRDLRVIKIEIEFDPAHFQVLEIEKGELLRNKEIKSHFFKTYDNQKGKIRLNFAFEDNPVGKVSELAVINCRAKAAGKSELKPVLFEVLDAKMKKIESQFPVVTVEVEK
jgi:general secretion pathway protein D